MWDKKWVVFVQQQQQEMGSFWYLTTNCFLGLEVETVYYKMINGGFHSKIVHVYAIFKEPIHNPLTTYIWGLSCQWKMRILCFSVITQNTGCFFQNVHKGCWCKPIFYSSYCVLHLGNHCRSLGTNVSSKLNMVVFWNETWTWRQCDRFGTWNTWLSSSLLSPPITFIFVSFRIIYKRQSSFCCWYVHTIF